MEQNFQLPVSVTCIAQSHYALCTIFTGPAVSLIYKSAAACSLTLLASFFLPSHLSFNCLVVCLTLLASFLLLISH